MSGYEASKAVEQVGAYYDANTRRFLRFGGSGESAAIHRQIWAPGVKTSEEAFLYLNRLVLRGIQPALSLQAPPVLLDLGCGVGGTATWLAGQAGVEVVGVTNSAVQHELALRRARQAGVEKRCRFLLADFMALPRVGPLNAAYAIESFVHASDAQRFFGQVNRQLAPGGRLVICDDFLAQPRLQPGKQAARWLRRFERDWHIHNLVTIQAARQMAQEAGFRLVEAVDLSACLRSFHPLVLRLVAWATQLPLRSAYWQNLSGGAALQVCVSRGWTSYLALIFEKEAQCTLWRSSEISSPSTG
jgi:cyclopropane fatty-acyl-phospholipid synthase-like methyltransferase